MNQGTLIFLAIVGQDRKGIIADLSKILFECQCNLEDISMTLLDGQFAMMIIFRKPKHLSEVLMKKKIKSFERRKKLTCFMRHLTARSSTKMRRRPSRQFIIHAIGPDRTGIVARISRYLAQEGFNITDLNSKRILAGKKPLYALALETEIQRTQTDAVKRGLRKIARQIGIDISINPIESYKM